MSGIKWIEKEAVLCANLSFASDRFLFVIIRSFFISSGNRQQQAAVTDKFNLNLQNCMLRPSACFYLRAVEAFRIPDPFPRGFQDCGIFIRS